METISLYRHEATDRPDVFRVMDLNGDWKWYFHQPTGRYIPAVNAVLHAGYPKDERFHQYLLSVSKDESKKILETAGERGARVHDAIQLLEQGQSLTFQQLLPNSLTGRPEPLSETEWKCLLAWAAFVVEWKAVIVPCRRTVLGTDYAGTLDDVLMVTVPESAKRSYGPLVGQTLRVLFDYKTSSGIWDEYQAQTAAYFFGDTPGDIVYTGILRLGTRHKNGPVDGAGYEIELWDRTKTNEHYGDFRCAYRFWRKNMTPFDAESMKESMPLSLSVTIPTTNQSTLPLDPGATGTEVTGTEDNAHVGKRIQDTDGPKEGVQADTRRVLPGGPGGHSAGGRSVQGGAPAKAPASVANPGRRRAPRRTPVPKGYADGK